MQRIAIAVLALLVCAPASAQTDVTGRTVFTFYSGELGDWANPAAKDTKVTLMVWGDPAKRMYDQLGAKSDRPDCAAEGYVIRARGDLSCARDGKDAYSCDIGIDLNKGKSILGSIC